jgi:hypothetical protein
MSSNTNNLRDILDGLYCRGLIDANPDNYKANGTELTLEEAYAAVLALLPEQPIFPSLKDYMVMVKKAEANNKYDDMYEYGYKAGIDQTRRNLIGEEKQ